MAASLLFLATAALFWDFLSPHTSLVLSKAGEDMTSDFIGWRQFAFEQLKQGHLALWNPQLLCGAPFFGDFQSALLYPPNWLFMVLPMPFAINSCIALHVFLMGWFTYLWISRRGSHPLSAMTAAFMVMFGAAYFLRIVPGHLPNLCAMPWIPLILFAVDGWRREREPHWILLGMAAITLQLLAGHVQYSYYTSLFAGVYVLASLPRERKGSFLFGFVLMGLGSGFLSAVQLLAGWDAEGESLRGGGLTLGMANIACMTPERLWCLLTPFFFGGFKDYWGGSFYWEGVVYGSVTAFFLALFALKAADKPQKNFFGWTALFLTVLALGTRTPLFILFHHWVPLFDRFRGVGKVDILITLCLACLAAMGLDRILEDPRTLKGAARFLGWGSLLPFTAALAVGTIAHRGSGKLYEKFGSHAGPMLESLLLSGSLLAVLALLSVGASKRPILRYGFAALACLEVFFFAKANLPFFDYKVYTDKVATIEKVSREGPGDSRVLIGNSYAWSTSAQDIWGEDPVVPSRFARFMGLTQHCDPENAFLQRFTFRDLVPALGLLRLRAVFREEGDQMKVERLHLKCAPRAFLVNRWEVLTPEEALEKAASGGFDFTREVLLESDPGIKSQWEGLFQSKVAVKNLSSDQMEVQAQLSRPEVLVITDNYSKGWKADPLDPSCQNNYQVLPANGFQIGIPLGVGNHHFVLEYRPTAFVVGKWISLVSLLIYLSACGWTFLRKMTSNPRRGKIGI